MYFNAIELLFGRPWEHRKAIKSTRADRLGNSFEVVAREWFSKYSKNWGADHCQRVIRRLERDIFPWIGKNPVGQIKVPIKTLQSSSEVILEASVGLILAHPNIRHRTIPRIENPLNFTVLLY